MIPIRPIASILEKYEKAPPLRQAQFCLVVGVVTFIATATIISQSPLKSILLEALINKQPKLTWLLLLSTLVLAISHAAASLLETQWASIFYPKLMPEPPSNMLIISAFYGASICLLAALSGTPEFYIPVYFLFCLIDILAMGMLSEQVRQSLTTLGKRKAKPPQHLLAEVDLYYSLRPWKRLGFSKLLVVGMAGAILYNLNSVDVVYAIIIFAVFVAEIVIWFWRYRLYRSHKFFFV